MQRKLIVLGDSGHQCTTGSADDESEQHRLEHQAGQQTQAGSDRGTQPAVPVGGLEHLRLTVVTLGDQRSRAQLDAVLDPALQIAEIGLRRLQITVCGDQDQLMMLLHKAESSRAPTWRWR